MKLLANENCRRCSDHGGTRRRLDSHGITGTHRPSRFGDGRRSRALLVTFDKDFGQLAFHHGLPATCGIILLRLSLADPVAAGDQVVKALASRSDWAGQFSVITERRIRMRPLPTGGTP